MLSIQNKKTFQLYIIILGLSTFLLGIIIANTLPSTFNYSYTVYVPTSAAILWLTYQIQESIPKQKDFTENELQIIKSYIDTKSLRKTAEEFNINTNEVRRIILKYLKQNSP